MASCSNSSLYVDILIYVFFVVYILRLECRALAARVLFSSQNISQTRFRPMPALLCIPYFHFLFNNCLVLKIYTCKSPVVLPKNGYGILVDAEQEPSSGVATNACSPFR